MRYFAGSLVLFAFLVFSGTAEAQPAFRLREGVQSGQVQALDRILEAIRRNRPGQLSDVQGPEAGPSGEPHYYIKWLTPDGRVLWLDTDARTGQVLGVQGGVQPRALPARPLFAPRGGEVGQGSAVPPPGVDPERFGGRGRGFPPQADDGRYPSGQALQPIPQGDYRGPGPGRRGGR